LAHTTSGKKLTELIDETFRLNGAILKAGDHLTNDIGLTSSRWQVLASLKNGPITVAEISREMGLSRQNVQRIANRLKQDLFIETEKNPAHLRSNLYILTTFGKNSMEKISKKQEIWANTVSVNMKDTELEQVNILLNKYRKQIEKSLKTMSEGEK
jgi:DNA-binding MarR family transcriptional regulator